MSCPATGYAHPGYAASLAEFGDPVSLPRSGGHLLLRPIGDSGLRDAAAPYPLLVCTDWRGLERDLAEVAENPVSVTAVTDPLGACDGAMLRSAFPDLARPYKQHAIVDLETDWRAAISAHHRRNLDRARRIVFTEVLKEPAGHLDDWNRLYQTLVQRHGIEGVARFSAAAFAMQFALPGAHVFRAEVAGETAGMLLWMAQGKRAYYHLGCYSEAGYRAGASFALFSCALEWFAQAGSEMLVLGAGAGASEAANDGLARFKRGWATGSATAWLCGRICDRAAYARLAGSAQGNDFFPAYRSAPRPALAG